MLNKDTKKHIDAARKVLVGVVPNPIAQVDQITFALIYKFMDDMDNESVLVGGEPSFFTRDLSPFSWARLMDSRIGNQERLNLYSEALQKFSESPQLPELFRTIFRSAFLPYKAPETLGLFLREIDTFDYSHSEELGNAYEYLLSTMSTQGDAGQFRTPRHIIEFVVDLINPKKTDRVLDPACGTAGFLIAAYKHILENHSQVENPTGPFKALTPDEKKSLMTNFEGYDIDPSMVRMAQVNMYLHQFKSPKVYQYDALTSEERWAEKFDVILANPPFMTPKGGIRPHSRFGIPSNRSEVLFVDYILSHLKPRGRAGIIVPESIVFQSGASHKALRKTLLDHGLYGVVSLPSGVFNPYSGWKTSILLIDPEIAKQKDSVLFVKVKSDGYDLGATKRKIDDDDLPEAQDILTKWSQGSDFNSDLGVVISRTEILEQPDYSLSLEKHRGQPDVLSSRWPIVKLSEVASISSGNSAPQGDDNFRNGTLPFFRTSDVGAVHVSSNLAQARDLLTDAAANKLRKFPKGTILFPKSGASTFLNHRAMLAVDGYVSSHLATINANPERISEYYLFHMLTNIDARDLTADQSYPSLRLDDIKAIELPLPPLEVQAKIVAEIQSLEAEVNEAREVIRSKSAQINAVILELWNE